MGIKYGYSDEIKLIGQVITNIEDLRQWCHDRISLMTSDVSTYTKDRYRLWLFHECNLKTGEITRGYSDDRIKKFSQRIYPNCNIGLLTFHGSKSGISSNGSIKPHRDHSYAMPLARSVNLGSCVFGYGDEEQTRYKLDDGDITEFNCKVLHSVPQILTDERFSIVFWKLNQTKGYFPIQ